MRIPTLSIRLLVAVCIMLIGFGRSGVSAQDDGTPSSDDAATGSLLIVAAQCADADNPPGVILDLAVGLANGPGCAPAEAALSIDGGDAISVSDTAEIPLPVGSYTVTDLATGLSLAVEIAADTQTAIERIEYIAPEPTAEPDTTDEAGVAAETEPATETVPVPGELTITVHLCPDTIANREAFNNLGAFDQQMVACPTILLPGQEPVEGAIGGGNEEFDLTLATGADATAQSQMLDSSLPAPNERCETDPELGSDIDGDGQLTSCYDLSGYAFAYDATGRLTVTLGPLPDNTRLGAAGFIPDSGDAQTLKRTSRDGVITLDTTDDPDVWLHVFLFSKPQPTPTPTVTPSPTPKPSPTPSPTKTPSPTPTPTEVIETGSLQLTALFCVGDQAETTLRALPPGVEATATDLGDSSCVGGNATFDLSHRGTYVTTVSTGTSGVSQSDGYAAGDYSLVETGSGASTTLSIEGGAVTRAILLSYATTGSSDGGGSFTTGDPGGPESVVGGGLTSDGGSDLSGDGGSGVTLSGVTVSLTDASGSPVALQDADTGDTEAVDALVTTGSGSTISRNESLALLLGFGIVGSMGLFGYAVRRRSLTRD